LKTIERVLLLQGVELFAEVTTEQLSFIAAIAQEVTVEAGVGVFNEGDPPRGLYVVLSGSVSISRGNDVIETIGSNGPFGLWALVDDQPNLVSATALEASHLLFIDREEFYGVLSDHVDITQAIFRQLVQRVRRLAAPEGEGK
jgi:CRP-like cAMP-binding protein